MRKAIGKKTRFEVFKRDLFTCQYCGAHPPSVVLQVDHIVAVANGGKNHVDNYVTSCQPCNIGKGATDLSVVPQALAAKAALVAERESQLLGYQAIMQARRDRIDDEMWRVADALEPGSSERGMLKTKTAGIRVFVEKLGVDAVLDAVDIATIKKPYSDRQRFLYFCGVCWRNIKAAEAPRG